MSQFFIGGSVTPPPPGVVVALHPDSGANVVPDGSGVIDITGITTTDTNFETFNGGTSILQVAHRYQGSATTVGATTQTILTIALTAGSTMNVQCQLAGIESTPLGVGGEIRGTAFRGGSSTLLGVPDKVVRASAPLASATFDISVSGNDLIVTVTGVAAHTIEWYVIAEIVVKTFI